MVVKPARVFERDVSASGRVVAAVIIGNAVGSGAARRVGYESVVVEPVTRSGALLAYGFTPDAVRGSGVVDLRICLAPSFPLFFSRSFERSKLLFKHTSA